MHVGEINRKHGLSVAVRKAIVLNTIEKYDSATNTKHVVLGNRYDIGMIFPDESYVSEMKLKLVKLGTLEIPKLPRYVLKLLDCN